MGLFNWGNKVLSKVGEEEEKPVLYLETEPAVRQQPCTEASLCPRLGA